MHRRRAVSLPQGVVHVKGYDKFVQTIPLALAMQTSQLATAVDAGRSAAATDLKVAAPDHSNGATAGEAPLFGDEFSNREPESFVWDFPQEISAWDGEHKKTFDDLVTKEAVGTITPAGLAQLNRLQKLRRQLKAPATGEEILQRHRREKLDRELVKLLERHVRLDRRTY